MTELQFAKSQAWSRARYARDQVLADNRAREWVSKLFFLSAADVAAGRVPPRDFVPVMPRARRG